MGHWLLVPVIFKEFLILFFSDNTRQAVCDSCPAGYYCLANSTTYSHQVCPKGFYCPNNTRHAYEFPCPRGTYSPFAGRTSLDDCQSCPPGEYCESKYSFSLVTLNWNQNFRMYKMGLVNNIRMICNIIS